MKLTSFLRSGILIALGIVLSASVPAFAAIEADVALSYSPDAAIRQGGEDNIQVNLANAIIGANSIHETSGTGVRWRIAGFYQSTANPVDQDNNYVLGLVNGDTSFQDVRDYAASVGADLVSYYAHTTGAAGNAYQPGNYSTMGEQWIWYIVVAHELGHNYGCAHQDGQDGTAGPKTVMMHNYCGGGAQPYFSNPNMWFNGLQMIGNGNVCLGAGQISGGDNAWRLATSAQGKADIAGRIVVGPNVNNVVLRWCFTNAPGAAPASTTVPDLITAAPAIVRGNGATFTGKGLRIPGGTTGNIAVNSMSAYIDLPNSIISARTNITIEIWATPLSAPNWARLCDFGRTTETGNGVAGEWTGAPGTAAPGTTSSSDDIMLSAAINTSLGSQRFEAKLDGGAAVTLDAGLATTAGVQHHYAITFTDGAGGFGAAGGRWQWFRDGDAIAYLDVNFHLSEIEDVNNWLGRSMWSADNNANNEYAEVRISNVALSRPQLLANALLGPNFFQTATVTLTNSDVVGATSFNLAGQWNNAAAPNVGETYETLNYSLRTPASAGVFTFGGNTLKITGGALLYKGTGGSTTINDLTLNGGTAAHAGSGTWILAGNVNVTSNGGSFNNVNGACNLSANLSGNGPVEFLANTATLSGNNTNFSGRIAIGNGAPGSLAISSPAQLGAVPGTFASNHVTLNRGTLTTSATMALTDATRGILVERGGGTFNVAAATTLTLSRVSTPILSASLVGGALFKTGGGTLVLSNTSSTIRGALYVDTSSTSTSDGIVRIVGNQTLLNAQSPIFIRNNNTGSSTLQLDGAAGNLTITKSFAVNCRNNATSAIQNLSGTNTITGFIALNSGGSTLTIQSDAGQLTFAGNHQYIGSLVGNRNYTFSGAGNHLLTGAILNSTNGSVIALAKTGSGTLTLAGANAYTGNTAVSGGTLLVNGSLAATPVAIASTATLGGLGTIAGAVTVQSGGTLAPGAADVGRLTVNNTVTLQSGSTTRLELDRTAGTNDLLRTSGILNLGGTLVVTNLGGTLVPGDFFTLFEAATFNGSFAAISLPPLNVGLTWSALTNGTISVIATNLPTITSYALQGNGTFELNGSGSASQGYTLQAATNLAPPINWVAATNSTASTNGLFQLLDRDATNYLQRFYRVSAP